MSLLELNNFMSSESPSTPVAYCAASESCALPGTARLNFEVLPGEIVEISRKGIRAVCQVRIFQIYLKAVLPQERNYEKCLHIGQLAGSCITLPVISQKMD